MLPVMCGDHAACYSPCSWGGRTQTGEPSSPSIFMPDINFHAFQYFMSVTT